MPDLAPFAHRIWEMKYQLRDTDGEPIDRTIEDMWHRVANALAAPEADPARWANAFYAVLEGFQFMPAGRILAGAGTGRAVTLFNCFVMGEIPDDMGGIFHHLKEAALTLQQGGGIGYDFSTIRPKGAPVLGVGADASGPLSFMDVWDAMCRTIMSAGARRGAMMATLRCDHPDIEAFVEVKRDPARLRMFNLSVLVTDAFMDAVEADKSWPLVFAGQTFREVRARDLWDRIMKTTYETAEPGVIFIDRINQKNNLWYCERIAATNPCGEQPLPPYGACLLGSVNLAALVKHPFEPGATLDMDRLQTVVPVAVRMMDNVVDVSRFALPQQEAEAKAKRRIGLGVTGLADALIMLGVRYGSPEAVALTDAWLKTVQHAAYRASADLAAEKGPFPLFDRDKYLGGETVRALDHDVRDAIARHGIRNALLTSIAPTGTISLVAGNISSGIEPVFAFAYDRSVVLRDGSRRTEEVADPAYQLYRERFGVPDALPDHFVTAQSLRPEDHVVMQAAAQKWVDSSISKTINCPETLPFEAFKSVYRLAYDSGCKGCTTYRPNPISGAVLSVRPEAPVPEVRTSEHPATSAAAPETTTTREEPSAVPLNAGPLARPQALPGQTYKVKWPANDHAIYITINDVVHEGQRRPFEVFINSKNMEHYAWTVALTLMISAVFRRGGDVSFVVDELKSVFDPRGGQWSGGRYVPSLLAAIGEVIERHMRSIGFLAQADETQLPTPVSLANGRTLHCPKCGAPGLIRQEGCDLCPTCGYSRCG